MIRPALVLLLIASSAAFAQPDGLFVAVPGGTNRLQADGLLLTNLHSTSTLVTNVAVSDNHQDASTEVYFGMLLHNSYKAATERYVVTTVTNHVVVSFTASAGLKDTSWDEEVSHVCQTFKLQISATPDTVTDVHAARLAEEARQAKAWAYFLTNGSGLSYVIVNDNYVTNFVTATQMVYAPVSPPCFITNYVPKCANVTN